MHELAREGRKVPLSTRFIDMRRAYETVDRAIMWAVLARCGTVLLPELIPVIFRKFQDGMRGARA